MDNRGNSRANTCEKTRLLGRVVFIRFKTNEPQGCFRKERVVIHNNCANRIGHLLPTMDHSNF